MQGTVLRPVQRLSYALQGRKHMRSFRTHVFPAVVYLLQVLVSICAHRLDTDRHLHWIHGDLAEKATGVIWQGRKGCVWVQVHMHSPKCECTEICILPERKQPRWENGLNCNCRFLTWLLFGERKTVFTEILFFSPTVVLREAGEQRHQG